MSRKYKFADNKALYFTTFPVTNWIDIFTRHEYCQIFLDSLTVCREKKGLNLHAYCLMTNHAHLLISGKDDDTVLWKLVRDMKGYMARKITAAIENNPKESRKDWLLFLLRRAGERAGNETYGFWQQHNSHPLEMYNQDLLYRALNYIHQNPVKTGIVDAPEHYRYSSASNYLTGKGVIEVDLLTF